LAVVFESPYQPIPLEDWARTNPVQTLPALFRRAINDIGAGPKRYTGSKSNGVFRYKTYSEAQREIHNVASALIELGIVPNDRVSLWSQNCQEWPVSDFGIAHAAAVNVPLYPTLSGEAIQVMLLDSGARVMICNTAMHLQNIIAIEASLPELEYIVSFQVKDFAGYPSTKKLYSWDDFQALGQQNFEKNKIEMERRIAAIKATDVTSIVYTSGTTGEPKGAMLMHGNFVSNVACSVNSVGFSPEDLELSFLPLCHVFERIACYCLTSIGASIAYAESVEKVPANLMEVRPTTMPSVPRLYEKIHAKIMDGVHKGPKWKLKLFEWALDVGAKHRTAKQAGKVPGWLQLQYEMAHKLVFKKIHDRVGGRIRFFTSGGAPLRRELGEFYSNVGFKMLEGYGLTETSPIVSFNPPEKPKPGTVGKAIPHTDIQIAADGEIIIRGPQIMLGYYRKQQATSEAIDEKGFFHTGDIGEIDSEGYLKITDRKKDLLVMSNGKNVAPQPIADRITSSPMIEQAVVLGDDKKFISALVYPNYPHLQGWLKEQGLTEDPQQLASNPKLIAYLQKEIDRVSEGLSHYEMVKKIAILPAELSMETGELTPTLKIKRKVVTERHAALIDDIYSSEPAGASA
jgi:long-chain acyl-CoA synthetase